jgi:hypothetical protein
MTGSDTELLKPMQGCLRCLTFFVVEISADSILVDVFFPYIMVLNLSRSGRGVNPEGEIPAVVTSLYDTSFKVIAAGIGAAGSASVEREAVGTRST